MQERTPIFFALLLTSILVEAQPTFKTIAPQEAVVAGESFRVQYVIEGAEEISNFIPPSFKGFRLVSGPEVYAGQVGKPLHTRSLKNMIYTLVALEPGHYYLRGALARVDGKNRRSDDILVEVISPESAYAGKSKLDGHDDNPLFLRPGEDPYEKIRRNLFLKVLLDRKTCYTGEAIVATFKLYSRVQSKSDIIKNPGFYGFTVQDMINLDDKAVATETVNGKIFDVHTIRKVQLYPLQPGIYSVDAMQIKNKVEFSRSFVNGRAGQEIIEGVFENEEEDPVDPATQVFETTIQSAPQEIRVHPLPPKNKPDDFNGATGQFSLALGLEKEDIARNEEGYLLLTIDGSGNFNQLDAPAIPWPAGIEGFEPVVNDQLDKLAVPLAGSRTFRYAFVSARPGRYILPALSLSYFDPGSRSYQKAFSHPVEINIQNRDKLQVAEPASKTSIEVINKKAGRIAAIIVALLVGLTLLYWLLPGKKIISQPQPETIKDPLPPVGEILKPAQVLVPAADKDFYNILHQSVWSWLARRFKLEGTGMSKQGIMLAMEASHIDADTIRELQAVLTHCETAMYTNASLEEDKQAFIEKIRQLLYKIRE